jgi:hypothetical protein
VTSPRTNSARTTAYRWFVASQFSESRLSIKFGDAPGPSGVVHAKEMGTRLTACGLDASSWTKYWELVFDPRAPEACPRCVAVAGEQC